MKKTHLDSKIVEFKKVLDLKEVVMIEARNDRFLGYETCFELLSLIIHLKLSLLVGGFCGTGIYILYFFLLE